MDREAYDKTFVNLEEGVLDDFDVFEACEFNSCQWSGSDLSKKQFIDCHFMNVDLSNIQLSMTSFRNVRFNSSKLLSWNISGINPALLKLSIKDCNLDFSVFSEFSGGALSFENCSFKNSHWYKMNMSLLSFQNSDFEDAQFEVCDFSGADFSSNKNLFFDLNSNAIHGGVFDLSFSKVLQSHFNIELK